MKEEERAMRAIAKQRGMDFDQILTGAARNFDGKLRPYCGILEDEQLDAVIRHDDEAMKGVAV